MSKQAQVGFFTILGALAVFAVFFVLSDLGTRARGYKIGVHFTTAGGLSTAADVSMSGVSIGAVDNIRLLRDYSTEVILAIRQGYDIPVGSRFLIQAPLTGEPSVLIDPPSNVNAKVATLPREVLPIDQQPTGTNPASVSDLLEQGQGEVRRLDDILSQIQKNEPALLSELKSTITNADTLTKNANRSLSTVSAQAEQLTASLQTNLSAAGGNVVDLTAHLDDLVKADSGQVTQLLTQLNRTARTFGQTMDSLHDVATNPNVKHDLITTAHDFASTARTFASISHDLSNVTGNPGTQAQLRDTVAQLDATSQKVDSLVGQLGGTSSVYGVDAGATAPPLPSGGTPPGGTPPAGAPQPAAPGTLPGVAPGTAPGTAPSPHASSGDASSSDGPSTARAPSAGLTALRERLNRFTKDLVQLQVRVSELAPLRPGSQDRNVSPLLTPDRGPASDFNVFLLPHAHTGLEAGVNDVGSPYGTATGNFLLLSRTPGFTYGAGIEYSQLGFSTSIANKVLGLEARGYDLRHPTLDTYVNLFAFPKFQIFGGERDLTHAQRRTTFGLQFEL